MLTYEESLYTNDLIAIAGCDEAGRGPLCGPLVVACCLLPKDFNNELINDSKQLTALKREQAFKIIIDNAIDYSIEVISPRQIDRSNIYLESKFGMINSYKNMRSAVKLLLTDAMPIFNLGIKVVSIIHGDAKSKNIAAASILAKVTRDRMMNFYSQIYPYYDLEHNKGYGTKKHLEAIKKYGVIKDFHRMSYGPCSNTKINLF